MKYIKNFFVGLLLFFTITCSKPDKKPKPKKLPKKETLSICSDEEIYVRVEDQHTDKLRNHKILYSEHSFTHDEVAVNVLLIIKPIHFYKNYMRNKERPYKRKIIIDDITYEIEIKPCGGYSTHHVITIPREEK